ncbi:MAG: flagellar biosynthesis anti-sigma factor FlgM [Rhodoferax sp.]
MKIGHPQDSMPTVGQTKEARQPKGAAAAALTKGSESVRDSGVAVTVSIAARGLEQANRGESADIDHSKVQAARTAIQNGTFVVNAEAIADKLLSNAQEMLKRTSV